MNYISVFRVVSNADEQTFIETRGAVLEATLAAFVSVPAPLAGANL
jgi:hypothetical protein